MHIVIADFKICVAVYKIKQKCRSVAAANFNNLVRAAVDSGCALADEAIEFFVNFKLLLV